MTNQQQPFDVKAEGSTVERVLEEVRSGRLSAEDALTAEKASDPVRSSLVKELEKMLEPSNPDGPAPSTSAGAVTANPEAEEEAKRNPNRYETVTVRVSDKVLTNTGDKGTYFDPEMKQDIGKEPVSVYASPFVEALLRNQELVKAR